MAQNMKKLLLEELPPDVALYPYTQEKLDQEVAAAYALMAKPGFQLTIAPYFAAISARRHSNMPISVMMHVLLHEQASQPPSPYRPMFSAPNHAPAPLVTASAPRAGANPVVPEMTQEQAALHLTAAEYREFMASRAS